MYLKPIPNPGTIYNQIDLTRLIITASQAHQAHQAPKNGQDDQDDQDGQDDQVEK